MKRNLSVVSILNLAKSYCYHDIFIPLLLINPWLPLPWQPLKLP